MAAIYPMAGVYKEIVGPERLVFTGAAAEADIYLQGMEEGWSQSLERLDEFVKEHLG